MASFRKIFASVLLMFAALAASPAMAQGAAIDQAKAQGIVGEMATGYLGVADASRASSDLKRRVSEVNARRLAIYTERSQKTGEPVATIAALAAEKQIKRAGAGEVVNLGGGSGWTSVK